MNVKLTDENVVKIFTACLFRDGEEGSNQVKAEGIMTTAAFHSDRLNEHKEDIEAMLSDLPGDFQSSEGGGTSFLNAGQDKHGNQWTGLHQIMEHLFQLGIAIGKVECLIPKEMWSILPGGMPYYVVN